MDALAEPHGPGLRREHDVDVDAGPTAPREVDEIEEELLPERAVPAGARQDGAQLCGTNAREAESVVGKRLSAGG